MCFLPGLEGSAGNCSLSILAASSRCSSNMTLNLQPTILAGLTITSAASVALVAPEVRLGKSI